MNEQVLTAAAKEHVELFGRSWRFTWRDGELDAVIAKQKHCVGVANVVRRESEGRLVGWQVAA